MILLKNRKFESNGEWARFASLPCLYCGVDSGPVLGFFAWIVGAGLLAFVSFLIWGKYTGKFVDEKSAAEIPLQRENDEDSL